MELVLLFAALALNFCISWANASSVGRYWSESKVVGGSFRAYIVMGYIMAIAGFTMAYGYVQLLLFPFILQMAERNQEMIVEIQQLGFDLISIFCVATMILTGSFILMYSLMNFMKEKALSIYITADWKTHAQYSNTVNAMRCTPNTLSRITKTMKEDRKRIGRKSNIFGDFVILAFLLIVFGGYFTANAILRKVDQEYDMFALSRESRGCQQLPRRYRILRRD